MASRQWDDREDPHLSTEAHELLTQLEALDQDDTAGRIMLLERALTLISRTDHPTLWAELQVELGDACRSVFPEEVDPGPQLLRTIACYDAALTVYTPEETPAQWADVTHM